MTRHGIDYSAARAPRVALVACMLAIATFAFSASPAFGVYSHNKLETTFFTPGKCRINDLAVDEEHEWLYIATWRLCYVDATDKFEGDNKIERYNYDGTPANFTAAKPYIAGNVLIADPGGTEEKFNESPEIAVDNSNSPNKGRLIVTSAPHLDVFNPSGEYHTTIRQPVEDASPNNLTSLDIGPDGSIYTGSHNPADRISKYNPAFEEVRRFYGLFSEGRESCDVRADTTGAVWVDVCDDYFNLEAELFKYEADQFTTKLDIPAFGGSNWEEAEPYRAKPSPFIDNPLISWIPEDPSKYPTFAQFDVDLTNNDLYVTRFDRVEIYSQGTADEPAYLKAPPFGKGVGTLMKAIAVDKTGRVFVAGAIPDPIYGGEFADSTRKIWIFGPGDILPDVHTFALQPDDVGYTTAHLSGEVELAGGPDITECEFEYGLNAKYEGPGSGVAKCSPDPASAAPGSNFKADTTVSGDLSGLKTGETYHVRLTAKSSKGENVGVDRTFIPPFVLKVDTLPVDDIDSTGAVLKGTLDPDNKETHYRFEYGLTTGYGTSTPLKLGGTAPGEIEVEQELRGLPAGRTFHYRIVASNSEGTTPGPDREFRVASRPDVYGVRTTDVTETSAILRAAIDPVGFETNYRFEYGTTPDYGLFAPAAPVDIGSGTEALQVSQEVKGLQPGVTYHFRVVAENKWGIARTPNATFDYAPPNCPNSHVRQQTGAAYLPDCRAYELVSPGAAGAVLLAPSNAVSDRETTGPGNEGPFSPPYNEGWKYVLNGGFATSPSRFTFFGGWGAIIGTNPPISPLDMYMATRSPTGWTTTVPGLGGDKAKDTGRKECSESMAFCIDHQDSQEGGFIREGSPYLYTAGGELLGRLPTNVDVIPGGTLFNGAQRMSGDFNYFVFASADYNWNGPLRPGIPFAPGAQTSGVGSAYLNDIKERTISIISRLPNGGHIPTDDTSQMKSIDFPGLTPDASHVLMSTRGPGKLKHLYMRVDDLISHVIANGVAVEPLGMTRDGSKVLYATKAALSPLDTDTSTDIYRWEEDTEEDRLLSGGPTPGAGNPGYSDACSATWLGSGCGAVPLTPERAHPNANTALSVPTAQDDLFAESSGDVFFYSPEILDPSKPGIRDEKNLYVYRDGAVHLVSTLDVGTQITRIQISPDGRFAAMLTRSRMTSFNSKGFGQMYTYDADSGEVRCASCNPSGLAPASDIMASQGGRFMADDGRTFFASKDPLVPRDQNGRIIDVYEYVDGRPQLITSGLGTRDFTGGGAVLSFSTPQSTGLEAVSRDGTDVYFSTYETLVGSDHNGSYVKFYDARSGGGFDESPDLAPCGAADECHGVDSSRPPTPLIGSGKGAPGGNHPPNKGKKKKKKKPSSKGKKKHSKKGQRRHRGDERG